jgi:hypothetical protein
MRYKPRCWGVLPNHFDSFPQIPLAARSHHHDRLYYESVRAVDWNSPGICGYSFYVDENLIRGIVSHKFGEPEPQTRDEYGQTDDLWFHMPIDPDERVSELWLRKGRHRFLGREEVETLIVRTIKGRSFTPGLDTTCGFPIDGTLRFTYKAIAILPPAGPSRMFYCRANHLWTYFAFERPSEHDSKGDLQGVTSWDQQEIQYSFPASDNLLIDPHNFVTTSASLSDVRTITPCRGWKYEFAGQVVGLLLTYGDGRQSCVGQVRLDCLSTPLSVSSNNFWLGCTNRKIKSYSWNMKFTLLCVSEPLPSEDTEYIEIPLRGRLEWAVSSWRSAVRHAEEEEPWDEIGQVMAGRKATPEYADPEINTFAVPIRVKETDP